MAFLDISIIVLYLIGVLAFGHLRQKIKPGSTVDYMLGGRRLTLPVFVASLVATWYGGVLGVGEYTFRYGISNWLVFGVPYYLAAFLFAMFLARKARRTQFVTIPDRLNQCYGKHTAGVGALVVYFWSLPAAYVLILGVLGNVLFGWPQYLGIIAGTLLVLFYAYTGGFRALARTDVLHFASMFLGFIVMFVVLVVTFGGYEFVSARIPATHLTWHGGNSGWYIGVWYVIALATLVDPSFFQNCYAARDEKVARRGILISILCWMLFDFLTTSCGLYARALLPATIDPISSFPLLGAAVLPIGLYGIFAVGMLATVISTADSYLFIAASTLGKDICCGWLGKQESKANYYTKWALILSAVLTIVISIFFQSVVTIWYAFGSIVTPMLLIPLFSTFYGSRRMRPATALFSMILAGAFSGLWLWSKSATGDGSYWLFLEPIFPGLIVSLFFYLAFPADKLPPEQAHDLG